MRVNKKVTGNQVPAISSEKPHKQRKMNNADIHNAAIPVHDAKCPVQ